MITKGNRLKNLSSFRRDLLLYHLILSSKITNCSLKASPATDSWHVLFLYSDTWNLLHLSSGSVLCLFISGESNLVRVLSRSAIYVCRAEIRRDFGIVRGAACLVAVSNFPGEKAEPLQESLSASAELLESNACDCMSEDSWRTEEPEKEMTSRWETWCLTQRGVFLCQI